MSRYSPGTVTDNEEIAFFLFHPEQIRDKGGVKPNAFGYVFTRGRSVQRESIATDVELTEFVKTFLSGKTGRKWHGVLIANASRLREITLQGIDGRVVCIYDTAERQNQAHAEICSGLTIEDNGDANELRHMLRLAFNADHPVPQFQYRRGRVLSGCSADNIR